MAATKYDAMIAALETIQNVTDKPDWMLREEELELREKMHNDKLEMSLMMTQIQTGTSDVDNLQDQINQYETDLVEVRAKILGTGKEKLNEIKLPEHKTKDGQSTPEELFKGYEKKYRDQLVNLERSKRDKQEQLNKLKYRYEKRGEEFGLATGAEAARRKAAEAEALLKAERRLALAERSAAEMSRMRRSTELRTEAAYKGTDPATITKDINSIYAGLQTQVSDEGIFGPDQMLDYAEELGGVYADNAEKIASKLTTLFTTSISGESFLTAIGNEDPIYMDFLTETGMPTQPGMHELNLLSLSGGIQESSPVDPMVEIQSLIEGLPPLVRRNK